MKLAEVGRNIRREREHAGLNQRDLADRAELSQPTLHRIEQGARANVSMGELDRLAWALGVPMRDLLHGNPVADRILIAPRAARTADQADLDEVRRLVVDLLTLDHRLASADTPQRAFAPFPHSGRSAAVADAEGEGRHAAEALRTRLGLGVAPVMDLPELLETTTHIGAGAVAMPATVSGVSAQDPVRQVAVVLVNVCDVPERQRFSYAHELGHVILNDGVAVDHLRGGRTQREIRCDAFARHFLAPLEGVRREWGRVVGICPPGMETGGVDPLRPLAKVARRFRVSLSVARIQCTNLGIDLSPFPPKPLPTNREAAWRFGWGPEYEAEVSVTRQISPPRRILEGAIRAYEAGSVGLRPLARLLCMDARDAEARLEETGIRPPASPEPRRIDARSMAAARRRSLRRDDEGPPRA